MKAEDKFYKQIVDSGDIPIPDRESTFHEKRGWRFDFSWPFVLVAVEIEGGHYSRGRHTQPAGFSQDCEKYNSATLAGWDVYRFTTEMVRSGEAIEFLRTVFYTLQRSSAEN